ncbi:MAG TPA: hypothetical protein VMY41_00580 [Thermohalobaculum sp.]|nr:hypothetical protein [Thermohalobaculum sp.]
MKIQTIGAIALSAAMAMASSTALAHGPHSNYRESAEQGYGPMMGQGCDKMMGQGGMMGMMQPDSMLGQGGMMGRGPSPMMGRGMSEPLAEDLSADGVRHIMTHRVAMMQNPNLKVGDVTETDDDTIAADVVTQDGSLVRRYIVDRHTGVMRPADMEE